MFELQIARFGFSLSCFQVMRAGGWTLPILQISNDGFCCQRLRLYSEFEVMSFDCYFPRFQYAYVVVAYQPNQTSDLDFIDPSHHPRCATAAALWLLSRDSTPEPPLIHPPLSKPPLQSHLSQSKMVCTENPHS